MNKMAKKDKKKNDKKNNFFSLNDLSDKLLNLLDENYTEINELDSRNDKFQEIINRELELANGVSSGSIIDFARYINSSNEKESDKNFTNAKQDPYTLLSSNSGDLFTVFQEYYKNRYVEIQDLKFISKFIPALGEAVNTTLDYIASADEISDVLLRNIMLPPSITDEQRRLIIDEIEKCEKKYDIKKKLKNHIYKNALVTGTTYVYAVSYKKLFSDYAELKEKNKKKVSMFSKDSAKESLTKESSDDYLDPTIDIVLESCLNDDSKKNIAKEIFKNQKQNLTNINDFVKNLSNFEKVDSSIPYPVLESLNQYECFEAFTKAKTKNESSTITDTYFTDSIKNESQEKKSKKESYDKTSDLYIKVLDFKRIVPIEIFDEVVGYYYIHSDKKKVK